jgi:hypothetical protein
VVAVASAADASFPGVVFGTAQTFADGVEDGLLAVGKTTASLVMHGRDAAADTWYRNVARVRRHARANVEHVRAEAGLTDDDGPSYAQAKRPRAKKPPAKKPEQESKPPQGGSQLPEDEWLY